ncbi:hypothetical protein [Paenibacillus xylanexedens]|uniref:hypothetical protein n=1 Tax=Paenibacillus xylanexedens TaxID=528191 RepID=UPI000F524843|nr:hypothetical protein [Paenibacillus xylanexedens]RPK31444.1 hypothetical protein EDO6_02071 [Paenibacillus xylanexedens]
MIQQGWGTGKTHYWKNELFPFIKTKHALFPCYITLYGVQSIEDVSARILHGLRQNVYLKPGLDPLEVDQFVETKSIFLCFDDLERASLDFGDILGYVNLYVEHKHIKTLFLCNEDPILSDSSRGKSYLASKEKVIGKTIDYIQSPNDALTNMIIQLDNIDYQKFLFKNIDRMIELFNLEKRGKLNGINLRTIKQAIYDFQVVYKESDLIEETTEDSMMLDNMFLLTLLLTNEIKQAKDISSKILLGETQIMDQSDMLFKSKDDIDTFLFQDLLKYVGLSSFKGSIYYYQSLGIYSVTGSFNLNDLLRDIKTLKETVNLSRFKATPEYLLLYRFWYLSDADFIDTIKIVMSRVASGKCRIGDYVNLYSLFTDFVQKGISPELVNMDAEFKNGINLAITNTENIKDFKLDRLNSLTDSNNKDFVEYIKPLIEMKQYQDQERTAHEWTDMIQNDPNLFVEKLYEYKDTPVFKY